MKKYLAPKDNAESLDLQEVFSHMKDKGADAVVMEVSSGPENLTGSTITFDIGIFTNLSEDHIGGSEHPDMRRPI